MSKDSIYETRPEQWVLLKTLFTNKVIAQSYMNAVEEDFFNGDGSKERIWLFKKARDLFKSSKTLFSSSVFKSELDKIVRLKKPITKTTLETEFERIMSCDTASYSVDYLVESLKEKSLGQKMIMAVEDILMPGISEGSVYETFNQFGLELTRLKSKLSKEESVKSSRDIEWRKELLKDKIANPEKYAGMKTGFTSFDRRTGGLFPSEVTLIHAHTGIGKSTLMRGVIVGLLKRGKNVLLVFNEESEEQVWHHFDAMISKIPYWKFKRGKLTRTELNEWEKKFNSFMGDENCGLLTTLSVPALHNVNVIEKRLNELDDEGVKVDVVALDYLDEMRCIEKAYSEVDSETKTISDFKNIARIYNISGITATQSDTSSSHLKKITAELFNSKEIKGATEIDNYNVRGSKRKVGTSNTVMSIQEIQLGKNSDIDMTYVVWLINVTKNRDGGRFKWYPIVERETGRIFEPTSEEIKVIDWDSPSFGEHFYKMTKQVEEFLSDDENEDNPRGAYVADLENYLNEEDIKEEESIKDEEEEEDIEVNIDDLDDLDIEGE